LVAHSGDVREGGSGGPGLIGLLVLFAAIAMLVHEAVPTRDL
jgi:hypothetical protein